MPTITRCPSCARALQVPDDLLGQMVQCPSCGSTFTASAASAAPPPPPAGAESQPPRREQAPPYVPLEPEDREEGPRRRARFDDEGWEEEDEYGRRPRRGSEASAAVAGPAIALMITGGVGIAVAVISVFGNLVNLQQGVGPPIGNQPGEKAGFIFGLCGVVGVMLAWGIVVLTGAISMKNLGSYGYAMTAAIVAMLPCNHCCLLGLPFGIWALVVLNRPEVKDAFNRTTPRY